MRAGTSVAISDAVGRQAVTVSKAGLRCSGNDLRPAVRLWGVYGEKSGLEHRRFRSCSNPGHPGNLQTTGSPRAEQISSDPRILGWFRLPFAEFSPRQFLEWSIQRRLSIRETSSRAAALSTLCRNRPFADGDRAYQFTELSDGRYDISSLHELPLTRA